MGSLMEEEVEKLRKEKRIVVAVDESEESMYALSWCLTNLVSDANKTKSTLILLYVKPPPPLYNSLDAAGEKFMFSLFFFFVQFPVYNLRIVCFFFCLYLLVVVVTIFRKLGFGSAGDFFFSQNIDVRSTDVR